MIVWALFDSGNSCYTQGAKEFKNSIEIYPIGLGSKSNHSIINLNLADYGRMFGNDVMFHKLDKLPKPDLILASPPCESWSIASAMWGGNACWKQETGVINRKLSKFTIRNSTDYDLQHVQFKYERSFFNRINGELCIYNTIEIIKRYQPTVFVIENPANSKIWHYINDILNFKITFDNLTYYNNYDYPIKKPTKFKSNINLNLKCRNLKAENKFENFSKDYNKRSNIPILLILDIYSNVEKYLNHTHHATSPSERSLF